MIPIAMVLAILGAGIGGAFVGAVAQASHDTNREEEYQKFWKSTLTDFQNKIKPLDQDDREELYTKFNERTSEFLDSYTRKSKMKSESSFVELDNEIDTEYLNPCSNHNLEKTMDKDTVDLVNRIFSFIKEKKHR